MSYQVIARKYRPQRFADVVGQEHVTQTLANAIEQKRIAHAYLFCGPRGTGKTTIARIFAKCLNTTGGPKVDFDEKDFHAQEITEGRSLDVLEIDGASNNGVEQVRELRETCKYAPANSQFKIYIIDEVHMLSTAAFNALLKTLEEPPAHVKFMFATTDPEKVLPTILSRCQRFDLRRIPAALITKHLAEIAKKGEGEVIDLGGAARYRARRGRAGMRDAESTLDQLISFCGDKIEEPDVLSMFPASARREPDFEFEAKPSWPRGDIQTALTQLNQLAQGGKDLGRLLSDLLNHFRNLLIFQISRGDLNLLEVSENEVAALKEQSGAANSDALMRILDTFAQAELNLRDAASKKIFLEVALLKAIEARNAVPIDAVLKQLNQMRGQGAAAARNSVRQPLRTPPARQKPMAQSASPPKETPRETPRQENMQAGAICETLPPVSADLDTICGSKPVESVPVGRASPFVRTYLLEAHPVSFGNNLLVIGFDPEFEDHLGLVDNARNHTLLQTRLAELGHSNCQIKFVLAEAPAKTRGDG